MIHSRENTPKEVFRFAKIFRKEFPNIPLVAVPSSYNKVREKELIKKGFNIVIYANHMLRASYPAMKNIALSILKNKRSYESDKSLLSIKEILNLIPGTK
jgi:2-methylisocitrate lyase-like PEP mutase family enzyme